MCTKMLYIIIIIMIIVFSAYYVPDTVEELYIC